MAIKNKVTNKKKYSVTVPQGKMVLKDDYESRSIRITVFDVTLEPGYFSILIESTLEIEYDFIFQGEGGEEVNMMVLNGEPMVGYLDGKEDTRDNYQGPLWTKQRFTIGKQVSFGDENLPTTAILTIYENLDTQNMRSIESRSVTLSGRKTEEIDIIDLNKEFVRGKPHQIILNLKCNEL